MMVYLVLDDGDGEYDDDGGDDASDGALVLGR